MRVLHLISSGGMYGAEAVILQLAKGMQTADPNSSLLAVFHHDGMPTPQLHEVAGAWEIETHRVSCRGQVDLKLPVRLRKLVESARVDVVHAHGYKADIYAYLAFRHHSRRPALVSTCHTWYDNDVAVKLYGAVDRRVLRSFDQVAAVSVEVQNRLRGAGVNPARTQLISNGVTVVRRGGADANRSRFHADGRLRVGLVGRLAPEKGVDVFLEAATTLRRKHPKVEFVVAGDGPERAALQALLQRLHPEHGVDLLGRQEDMPAFLASLDVLVSTSRQEGLPVALLEGMAAGLPVVATRVGEVPQVVQHGITGFLVNPDSCEETAAATERMLADASLRKRFGDAGRERIRSHFSAEQMLEKYLNMYRTAIAYKDGELSPGEAKGEAV